MNSKKDVEVLKKKINDLENKLKKAISEKNFE